jgi:hypothetical protein
MCTDPANARLLGEVRLYQEHARIALGDQVLGATVVRMTITR